MEMAHTAMPSYPELDPIYRYAQWNHQVLNALVGKAYLHLAEHFPTSGYAQQAYIALEKSTNLQAVSRDSLHPVKLQDRLLMTILEACT